MFNAPCPSSSFGGMLEMFRETCDEILKVYLCQNKLEFGSGVDDPILAHCYSNRSAAFLELKNYEVGIV